MNQSMWDRAKSLLADAAILPAVERERFVKNHCSDPLLRGEVLELLASPAPLSGIVSAGALEPGARLGPYVIDRLIGRGGMGEVYKAQDTALNRSVAIKVLPVPSVGDFERQARFRREAQFLAALNHPNIAHIHGFEESTGVAALVMELVDGPTLADRLQRAMPLAEALSIASQIVDALEAAHEQGIIHRDLKPANIKVREDGTVKVLDFGLARTFDVKVPSSAEYVDSPTMSTGSTHSGLVLGTPAYMAPEQALGKTADKRADIWSFGCVLYEMLTAKRAFPGTEISDTLSRVIATDPDWAAIPPSTPAPILRLLRRCLEKPLNRRLADIADARLDIEEALGGSTPDSFVRWRRALPWVVAAACVGALAIVLISGSPWRTTPIARPMRLSVELGLSGEAAAPASPAVIALSPDGANVAFAAVKRSDGIPRLYLRNFDRADAVLLPGTDHANGPFFSPDGQWIAFFTAGKLKKIAVTGGTAITLCDAPNGRGGSWGDDGTIVFSADQQATLSRVSSTGGTPEPLTTLDVGEKTQRFPQVLPGGKAVLYSSLSPAGDFDLNQGSLVVQALPNGVRKVLLRGAFYGRYAASGHLLYLHDDTLFAAPFDRERLELTGPSRPLADHLVSNETAGTAMFAVSSSGALVYVRRFMDGEVRPITWLDRSGRSAILRSTPSAWTDFSFAPDGRRLAFTVSDGKQGDIWVDDWARDLPDRVTHYNSGSGTPVWTPDGRRIVFSSMLGEKDVASTYNLYWQQADGSGSAQRLATSPNLQTPGSWHPSGKTLAFTERQGSHSAVMLLPMEGDERSGWKPGTPTAFLRGAFDVRAPAFSPDGRWLAYESNQSGQYNVYVRPFPSSGSQMPISTSGGEFPTWSRTRHELIYSARDRQVMIVDYSVAGDSFHADEPRPWPEAHLKPQNGHVRIFDLHPDGDRLVLPAVGEPGPAPKWDRLELILNFFDELRRIAPAQTR
jgi:Tol biopolymer transport system component/tRNA A-37 threonylcarbamoyl transferase component Bud32